MSRERKAELTNMCMIHSGDKILVQNRPQTKGWPGIVMPGGHVEQGESLTQSVIREVFEETGLTISNPKLCGVKDWQNDDGSCYMVFLFHAYQFSGELKPSEEGEVFWTEPSALSGMNLASGMEETFEIFFRDDISELFYDENNEIKFY